MSHQRRCSLHFDGAVKEGAVLSTAASLVDLMYRISDVAKMRIVDLMITQVEEDLDKLGEGRFADEGGISVGALISTSHIYLHGWPNRSRFMFDLVSCRDFDPTPVIQLLIDSLGVSKIEHISGTVKISQEAISDGDH